jgi:hypothetical protein
MDAKTIQPTFLHFLLGAFSGAACGVLVRIAGGLVLNDHIDRSHIYHFLFESSLVPELWLYAFMTFIAIGAPVFLLARKRKKLSWQLFGGLGVILGCLASYPVILVPPWVMMYALSGLTAGLVGYFTMYFLAARAE